MKTDKQMKVISILSSGRYTEIDGSIYSVRNGVMKKMKCNILPTGYIQLKIYNGKRGKLGLCAVVYAHHLVWLINNGSYDETLEIDHIDRNKRNNSITNLRTVSKKENLTNRPTRKKSNFKTIRSEEIEQIKTLHCLGSSQSAIAKELNLNRLSVRYIIKKIESGSKLKYEAD